MNNYKILLDQINNIGGVNNYKLSSNSSNPWNRAYDLYNRENKRPMRKGCLSCVKKVYNWLKKNA